MEKCVIQGTTNSTVEDGRTKGKRREKAGGARDLEGLRGEMAREDPLFSITRGVCSDVYSKAISDGSR